MQWHITDRCDQRCKHCYIYQTENGSGRAETELSLPDMLRILESFLEFCSEHSLVPGVTLTGGDPLLSPVFWQITEELKRHELAYAILGNPFHLNQEVCDRLQESGCRSYQMSLDGLESTHDKFRKPGSFRATLSALQLLRRSGVRANIMATVSKANSVELPSLAKLCVEHSVSSFAFARYSPTHSDLDSQFSPQEYRAFMERMWSVYCELADKGTNFSLKDHLWSLFLYEKGKLDLEEGDLIIDGCNCGIRHITVLPDGMVYACRRFESPVGKVPESKMTDVFFGQEMERYRAYDKFVACSQCELLRYCRGCPAVAYGTTGSFYAKDPQCWK